jgi:hypothetical protein
MNGFLIHVDKLISSSILKLLAKLLAGKLVSNIRAPSELDEELCRAAFPRCMAKKRSTNNKFAVRIFLWCKVNIFPHWTLLSFTTNP